MPHLQATRLFVADGLVIRRVACDGVDHPRPQEEQSDGARIVIALRGRFTFRDRDVRAVASPCVGLYLRDGHTYQIRHVDDEGDVCVAVQGQIVDALVDAGDTARDLPASAQMQMSTLAGRLARQEPASRLDLEETLCQALIPERRRTEHASRRDHAIADAIGYSLACGFRAPLPLHALAGAAGVSVFHACRAFKRATGTTIHRYQQELRLRHALALLLETDLPLAQLAVDAGFANQPHLTNRFRRRFQTTPQVVRRSKRLG